MEKLYQYQVKGLQQLIRTISMVKKRLNRKLTIQGDSFNNGGFSY